MRHAHISVGGVTAQVARGAALAIVAGFGLVLFALRGDAQACGGLFCNARPPDPFAPLPVAQNGENVVFSMTKDPAGGAPTLAAYIQILYTGDAAKFSWVVPVDAVPVLSTGTDRLFSSLSAVTQPRFQPSYTVTGQCIPQQITTGGGGFFGGTGSAGTTGSAGSNGAGGAGGVMIAFQGAVGPFDAVVLKSTDPTELKKWLTDNQYVISDAAGALIDTYVRENKYFVALKLLNGVGVRSIQPIVLTFRAPEPCVPLRLTAIAANPDMPVLVWVLSDKRVVPRGFYELKIDEMRIDWLRNGTNYFGPKGLVGLAADEAGGNAFVAEYAGPSDVARAQVYANGQFNLAALMASMTPPVYVQQMLAMGLGSDSLTLPLLAQYIPMPDAVKQMGVTESQFYGNLNFYWAQYAFPTYDLPGLTNAIQTSIIKPRMEAQMMIDAHPYLTRLNTFISPAEMNQDPFFFESSDLGNVSNVHTAVINTMCGNQEYLSCNAPVRLELPDGRMAWLKAGSKATTCGSAPPDVVALQSLPAAEVAWEREATGEGRRVVDNTTAIKNALAANNAKFPNEQTMFPIPTGSGGATGSGGTVGSGGATGSGGAAGQMGPDTPDAGGALGAGGRAGSNGTAGSGVTGVAGSGAGINPGSHPGCGCEIAGRGPSELVSLAALALIVIRRRARRRRAA